MTSATGPESGAFTLRRHGVAYVLLAIWCGGVWVLSSRSDPGDTVGLLTELPDWLLHGVEFAAGGLLAAAAFSHLPALWGSVTALAFCVSYGVVDEWHQSFVPGRFSDLGDVTADAIGALVGIGAWTWIARRAGVPDASRERVPPTGRQRPRHE